MRLYFKHDIRKSGTSCKFYNGIKSYVDTGSIEVCSIKQTNDFEFNEKPSRANVCVEVGDVLFAKMQNSIKVIEIDDTNKDFVFSTGFYCFKDERIIPAYLKYLFLSKKFNTIKDGKCVGATMKAINDGGISSIYMDVPDRNVQEKAVKEINLIFELLALLKEQASYIDEFLNSYFNERFGDVLTGDYKFNSKKLHQVAKISSSHRVFTTEFVSTGIPFYRGTEIGILSKNKKVINPYFISKEHYERISNDDTRPKLGDLLLPSICNDGQIWLVDTDAPFYYKDGRVLSISSNRKLVDPKFLQFFLKLKTKVEYPKLSYGATFAEFKIFILKDIDTVVPPLTLQQKFSRIITEADTIKENIQLRIEFYNEILEKKLDEYFYVGVA